MAEPFSEEQTESLKTLVGSIVNSAISARDKMADKKRQEDRDAVTAAFAKTLDEKLSALKPPEREGGEGGGEGGGKGKNGKGERSLEFDTLKKQLQDQADALRQQTEKTRRAEERRREIERNNRVDGMLAKVGIADPFMRELAAAHFDRKGRVVWEGDDDDAKIVWNGDDGVQVGFDEGFASWAKSDEAKRFLPAAGKGGSGSRPGNGKPPEPPKNITLEDVGNFVLGQTLKT
jgi:hypothetical protein